MVLGKSITVNQLQFDLQQSDGTIKTTIVKVEDNIKCTYIENRVRKTAIGKIVKIGCDFNVTDDGINDDIKSSIYIKIYGQNKQYGRIKYLCPSSIIDIQITESSPIIANPICTVVERDQKVILIRENESGIFQYTKDGITWKDILATGGANGKSAYDIAVDHGFVGTEIDWLLSLKGEDGIIGVDGKSAYQIALDNGFVGTESEWLASLKGEGVDASDYYTKTETDNALKNKMPIIANPDAGKIAIVQLDGSVAPGEKGINDITANAANITIDSSQFSKNLTQEEDTLQKALERVDKFSFTDVQISNWISGEEYLLGDIRIYKNTLVRAKVNTTNPAFDPKNEWETISGSIVVETKDMLPIMGSFGILYVVSSDSSNENKPCLYIWNESTSEYIAIVSGNSSTISDTKQVLVSPTDSQEGYLETKIIGSDKLLVTKTPDENGVESLVLSLIEGIFDASSQTTDDIAEGLINKYYVKNDALNSVGEMFKDTPTIDVTYDNVSKKIESKVLPNTTVQKIEVAKNADLKATRKRVNFVEGVGIKIETADDALNDKIDITIKSEAEVNTASNIGQDGVGVFLKKDVYDLQFKKLSSTNGKLLIEDDQVNNKVKFTIDDSKLSIDASQINGLTEAISHDQSMTGLLADRHTHANSTILNGLSDTDGHLSYNGHYVGDMVMDAFDANKDGIVDIASTLVGLAVSVDAINYLQGVSSNIQAQINALARSLHYEGSVNTHADLIAIENPTDGSLVVVLIDETHSNGRSQYIYSEAVTSWVYNGTFDSTSRDFTINPLKLSNEVTGILSASMIDQAIARKTDIPQFANKTLLDNLSDVNGILHYLNGPIFDKDMVIDDTLTLATKTWSSYKISKENGKVGTTLVDETNRGDNHLLIYDELAGKLRYSKMFIPEWTQLTYYEKGYIVWVNDTAKRCKTAHTSGLLFSNDVDNWNDIGGGGGGGTSTLREVSGTITVAANDSVFVHLNTGFNKYDIRSIYATSMISEDIAIEIYNQTNNGTLIYQSLENPVIQDIVNAPCEDKDSTKCIHVKFFNRGTTQTDINYLIYITSLL